MAAISTATIGFPRIGSKRQMKTALESYWAGKLSEDQLLAVRDEAEVEAWQAQQKAGINRIGLDGTLYDQILDIIYTLGLAPSRFQKLTGLAQYFAMARGTQGAPALDMSKFFDTNYHFLVPELEADFSPKPNFDHLLTKVQRGQKLLGKDTAIPIVMGPITLILLAKSKVPAEQALERVLPVYVELLTQIKALGVPEVQIHEPILASDKGAGAQQLFNTTYAKLSAIGTPIDLVTYFDDIGAAYPWVVQLPVAAISLDFVGVPGSTAGNDTLSLIRQNGFPANKRLGAGVVDGRSVWADDKGAAAAVLSELGSLGVSSISIQSSTTLQLLPFDLSAETQLPADVVSRLAFAVQKLDIITDLAKIITSGGKVPESKVNDPNVDVDPSLFKRPVSYEERRAKQPQFPPFPTTTIGSFPQTPEVRRLRLQLKSGKISQEEYERQIDMHISFAIGVQESLELDVLVHGESERTDMVEYFGVSLDGLAFTLNGWVQSYGSRYVRPPLIVGDVQFQKPMTVREFQVAQSLTKRPVKGMLTGPVTILNWSFPRKDISRRAQAFQLALALRQEVAALQEGGCRIVQVDEPALREGLPLKQSRWEGYLTWAVDAFRLSTSCANPETQIVTHLCYSDFQDIMHAIDDMDADVLTIENSRSDDEMVKALANAKYSKDLGPGVYDVHSPVVPTVEFMADKIESFINTGVLKGRPEHIWINPDCGLKTRRWEEVIPSLRNMVAASKALRAKVTGTAEGQPAQDAAAAHSGGCRPGCC
eukprot:jgi/Chrzof1/2668/Cz11g24160.t1